MIVRAPWSERLVEALNEHQQNHQRHPYTCPGDQPECAGQGNNARALVATPDGWVCKCGHYTQDWCHAYA